MMKLSSQDLAFFHSQLASMVRLKTPLAEGMEILCREVRGKNFKNLFEQLHSQLAMGKKLSEALAQRPDVFSPTYLTLIEAGEASGDLDTALESMADYSQTTSELKTSLINAALIPVITLCVATGIFTFVFVFILPRFKEIFMSLEIKLPAFTTALLGISAFLIDNYFVILVTVVLLFAILIVSFWKRLLWLDVILLNLPVFGELLRSSHYTRICLTISHLLKNKVPLPIALELASKTTKSPVFKKALQDIKTAVEGGQELSEQMRSSRVFTEATAWKLAFAEKKGNLAVAFEELYNYFIQYFRMIGHRTVYLMTPILVIFLGTAIGCLVLGVFLPIFRMQTGLIG